MQFFHIQANFQLASSVLLQVGDWVEFSADSSSSSSSSSSESSCARATHISLLPRVGYIDRITDSEDASSPSSPSSSSTAAAVVSGQVQSLPAWEFDSDDARRVLTVASLQTRLAHCEMFAFTIDPSSSSAKDKKEKKEKTEEQKDETVTESSSSSSTHFLKRFELVEFEIANADSNNSSSGPSRDHKRRQAVRLRPFTPSLASGSDSADTSGWTHVRALLPQVAQAQEAQFANSTVNLRKSVTAEKRLAQRQAAPKAVAVSRQAKGPDGGKGFAAGRGKSLASSSSTATNVANQADPSAAATQVDEAKFADVQ